MPHANWRELLLSPGLKLGLFAMEFATPGLPMIVQRAGADFLVLDMEHSGFGFETVKAVCMGGRAAGLPMVVRVAHRHPNEVSRALDMGADALMAPLVSTAEQAREFVAWATYPPSGGSRGVAMMVAHDAYQPGPAPEKMAAADARKAILIQIETRAGAENADAIAALDGVDCLWIGHMDLSCSLGIPGQFEHPDFLAAEAQVREAARRHRKAFGRLAASSVEAQSLTARGYDTLGLCSDIMAIHSRVAEGVALLRGDRQ
ncbi:HpcH/HpaI aldolase family protein [Muricoccus pecuniae]|uniref:2-dehydro-3-deoxyglucarate aldolase/4-hydroxy-2-oxoheptanedioate aldolase n=1 Tax=Muricoccus pecuniae TaxID=693023 RepID=A0A840XZT1_9PROT|nr:aldolase/citrate lyase family protein [Roseomonas pecuniae]MBB5694358.1 2-dehydro-3-deoxyglucarate aldolase/4-hydroxy-2-oxoheptanedioate aldolase [Roseomonas pecuniae]